MSSNVLFLSSLIKEERFQGKWGPDQFELLPGENAWLQLEGGGKQFSPEAQLKSTGRADSHKSLDGLEKGP